MKTLSKVLTAVVIMSSALLQGQDKSINTDASTIKWKAGKVTGSHEGTLKFQEGTLNFKNDKLTGGNLVVDMGTIQVTDLEPGQGKEKLEGHLNSNDFFGTADHQTAKLMITDVKKKANGYMAKGDMMIKGKKNPVTFQLTPVANGMATAIKIDRTKYDIRYGSGSFFDNLGDKAIDDEFTLDVVLNYDN